MATSFVSAVGSDTVSGIGNGVYDYALSGFAVAPEVAILSSAAMDGGDGGWPVLMGDLAL